MSEIFVEILGWNFDGFSVADGGNGKALGIGNPFPADDYDPDFFREFPEGTELPKDYTPVDGEARNVRVLEEGEHEQSPEEPYLFRSRSIVSFRSGEYENLTYIIRDGRENFGILSYNAELNVYVAFEFDSEMISKEDVEAIASSVRIEERW